MAATFRNVPRSVPSSQRRVRITNVVEGDNIDLVSILGRPARRIKITPAASSDNIVLRFNNKLRIPAVQTKPGYGLTSDVPGEAQTVISNGSQYSTQTFTGSSSYYSEEGMSLSHITVFDITYGSGGSSITIEAW